MNEPVLSVQGLKKYFPVKSRFLRRRIGWIKAVDGISFDVFRGEVMGLVGESGCGKSTLAKTILGLYKPDEGQVIFKDREITELSEEESGKCVARSNTSTRIQGHPLTAGGPLAVSSENPWLSTPNSADQRWKKRSWPCSIPWECRRNI